jgi:serine/threonine protein kinase
VLQREGTYLRKLQHRNIVRCLKVYQAPQQWVFVLEYLKGGMLLNDLAKVRSSLRCADIVSKCMSRESTLWNQGMR